MRYNTFLRLAASLSAICAVPMNTDSQSIKPINQPAPIQTRVSPISVLDSDGKHLGYVNYWRSHHILANFKHDTAPKYVWTSNPGFLKLENMAAAVLAEKTGWTSADEPTIFIYNENSYELSVDGSENWICTVNKDSLAQKLLTTFSDEPSTNVASNTSISPEIVTPATSEVQDDPKSIELLVTASVEDSPQHCKPVKLLMSGDVVVDEGSIKKPGCKKAQEKGQERCAGCRCSRKKNAAQSQPAKPDDRQEQEKGTAR